jgi:hypothetical protein
MSARSGPDRSRRPYLGYRDADRNTPFAQWFNPQMAPLSAHVVDALNKGPQPAPLLSALDAANDLLAGDGLTETGYAIDRDGSMRVSVHTAMPGVAPEMWDWWFGWHGSDPRRYKLWHPRAHLYAEWNDGDDSGRRGRDRYVGRTSFVDEYLGSTLARAAIQFVRPSAMGFDEAKLADPTEQTAVCARLGSSDQPVDIGWLVHHVRAVDGGSEMRSRFWLGGRHIAPRRDLPGVGRVVQAIGQRVLAPSAQSASELLIHCAQEMAHLAAFLPDLHANFGNE